MCYATGNSPLGPCTYRGYYMLPVGCETTHGSVVNFKGKWYACYHNNAISHQNELRSICCDELEFNDDGTIMMVKQTRNGGLPVVADGFEAPGMLQVQSASQATELVGVTLNEEPRSMFERVLTGFEHIGAKARFEGIDGFEDGRVSLGLYFATPVNLAKVRLVANGQDWSLLNCPYTGSMHTFDGWATITITMQPGQNNVIEVIGGDGKLCLEGISSQPLNERE